MVFKEEINKIGEASIKKANFLKNSKSRYVIASALAGTFVGFGILLIFTIGGTLSSVNSPATKIVMGISFAIALSLVIMAGSELFTGNNMVMTIGILEKKVTWKSLFSVWFFSYVGNFIGAIILAALFVYSGLSKGVTADFIIKASAAKMSAPFIELLVRGILCNILVCLAVWCSFKLKEETAKLIMIFWCLFAFITSGFEHSVANMTLLSISVMIPHKAVVSLSGLAYNLTAVTLGNIIGGMIFVAFAYWYVSNDKCKL